MPDKAAANVVIQRCVAFLYRDGNCVELLTDDREVIVKRLKKMKASRKAIWVRRAHAWLREVVVNVASKYRLQLSVIPQFGQTLFDHHVAALTVAVRIHESDSEVLCVEIVNRGTCEVTVQSIGVLLRVSPWRVNLHDPQTGDGKPFARTLGVSESVTAYLNIEQTTHNIAQAYVITDAGEVRSEESPVFHEVRWRTYDPYG